MLANKRLTNEDYRQVFFEREEVGGKWPPKKLQRKKMGITRPRPDGGVKKQEKPQGH